MNLSPTTQHQPPPATGKHLATIARECRSSVIDMLTQAKSSHIGCSFSVIDILVVLYHYILDVEKIKQQSPDRDYFILSKGHAASGLYAVLASVGLIEHTMLKDFHRGFLAGHPTRNCAHGIEASTGSLGHGLSMGVGLALAAKHDNRPSRVYVIVGDGECQEGSIWEALTMAARFGLNNLVVIVDNNNLQGFGRTDTIATGSLHEKFTAFGCTTTTVDGHDYAKLIATISGCTSTKPHVIIAKTIKGKGLSFIEDKLEWHYKSLTPEQSAQAHQEVSAS